MSDFNAIELDPKALYDLDDLARSLENTANYFYRWRMESSELMILDYQQESEGLDQHTRNASGLFQIVLKSASGQSKAGVIVAREVGYFVEQLLQTSSHDDVKELLQDLPTATVKLIEATSLLSCDLENLQNELIVIYRRARKLLNSNARERRVGGSAESTTESQVHYLLGLKSCTSRFIHEPFQAVRGLAHDASSFLARPSRRSTDIENGFRILRDLEQAAGAVSKILMEHAKYWSRFLGVIEAVLRSNLLRERGLLTPELVQQHAQGWKKVESMFRSYGSTIRLSRDILDLRVGPSGNGETYMDNAGFA